MPFYVELPPRSHGSFVIEGKPLNSEEIEVIAPVQFRQRFDRLPAGCFVRLRNKSGPARRVRGSDADQQLDQLIDEHRVAHVVLLHQPGGKFEPIRDRLTKQGFTVATWSTAQDRGELDAFNVLPRPAPVACYSSKEQADHDELDKAVEVMQAKRAVLISLTLRGSSLPRNFSSELLFGIEDDWDSTIKHLTRVIVEHQFES